MGASRVWTKTWRSEVKQLTMEFKKIRYEDLNARAQELYNFQKVSAVLADYGFSTMWLTNDWSGADFLAVHFDGDHYLKVQLKGRLTFDTKYKGKNIYVCFRCDDETYLYPHDQVLQQLEHRISDRKWQADGKWSSGRLTSQNKQLLSDYRL